MHNLMSAVSRRRAGLAAGVVLAGGLAGGVLLAPGTAFAAPLPLISTGTTITNVTQSTGASGTTLDVFVNVTPSGNGGGFPAGTVKVTDGVPGSGCFLTLVQDGVGSAVGTGNCDIPNLPAGSYPLVASYQGSSTFGGSTSVSDTVVIGSVPVFTADSPSLTVGRGDSYSYNFSASGNPAPVYSLSGGNGWLSINSSTGAVSGQIPGWASGSFSYSVTAKNSQGSAVAGPFTVTIGHRGGHPGGHASLSTSLKCTSPVRSGARGTCTLWVTNSGSNSAQDVTGNISLPFQLTADFCGHNWGWGWFNNFGCSINGNTATEDLGTVNAGQTKSVTVTFTAQSIQRLWGWGHQFNEWVRVDGSASAQSQGFWGWFGGSSSSHTSTHVQILPQRHFWW